MGKASGKDHFGSAVRGFERTLRANKGKDPKPRHLMPLAEQLKLQLADERKAKDESFKKRENERAAKKEAENTPTFSGRVALMNEEAALKAKKEDQSTEDTVDDEA